MITIHYKICYEPPSMFRTYGQLKESMGLGETTYDVITLGVSLAKDEFIIKIIALQLNETSVQLYGVSNPLTRLKEAGKL